MTIKTLAIMLNYFLITLLTWRAFANTNNQYLVCKSASNILQEGSTVGIDQALRGRPGPRGLRGPRGFPVNHCFEVTILKTIEILRFLTTQISEFVKNNVWFCNNSNYRHKRLIAKTH